MGETGGGSARDEIDAIVGRIATMAFADERLRRSGPDEKLAAELDAALAFLPELRLPTLRALDRDLARPDSLATCGVLKWGSKGEPGTVMFLIMFASPPSHYYWAPRSATSIDAELTDLLLFRNVLLAHGDTMFFECLTGVKDILALGPEDSLAEQGVSRYGARGIASILNISVSLAKLQLSKTSAHITPQMGYAGMDAYADAKDDCHSMTAALARWILQTDPGPDEVARLAASGRLAKFDISPSALDSEQLRAELSKLDLDAQVAALPGRHPQGERTGPAGTRRHRRPNLQDLDDGGKRSFEVHSLSSVATAGDALEKHISRRESNAALRRLKAVCWCVCPLAAVLIGLWLAGPLVGDTLAGPALKAWKSLGVFILAEVACGTLLAMGINSWLDLRSSGFFLVARELNHYTVLQGRRDKEFLRTLRVLRPGLFAGSRTGGVPRLFPMCFSRDGAMLVGGAHLGVVATFPWETVREILAEPTVRGRKRNSERSRRVSLVVRHEGADVRLAFPLERAKVAWTSRTFLEAKPLEAALAGVQGLQTLSLVDAPVPTWEPGQHQPQAPVSAAHLRSRRRQILQALAAVAAFCAASPLMLLLLLR